MKPDHPTVRLLVDQVLQLARHRQGRLVAVEFGCPQPLGDQEGAWIASLQTQLDGSGFTEVDVRIHNGVTRWTVDLLEFTKG